MVARPSGRYPIGPNAFPALTVPANVDPALLVQKLLRVGPRRRESAREPLSRQHNPDLHDRSELNGSAAGRIFPANNAVNSSGKPVFQGGNNVPTSVKEEIVRIDHQFNSKFSVYGHYLREQIAQNFGTSMWSGDNVPTASNTFGNPSYSYVIHTTYVISPTLLNEVAFNANGNQIHHPAQQPDRASERIHLEPHLQRTEQ